MAKALLDKHPEKALKIYLSLVKEFNNLASRDNYRVAALYARNVKEIMVRHLGKATAWKQFISRIREENRRRPALIEEFRKL